MESMPEQISCNGEVVSPRAKQVAGNSSSVAPSKGEKGKLRACSDLLPRVICICFSVKVLKTVLLGVPSCSLLQSSVKGEM